MKRLLILFFCAISLSSLAQTVKRYKQAIQSNIEGHQVQGFYVDSIIGLPRYAQKLDPDVVKYLGRGKDALLFADTLHNLLYWYNPHTGDVDTVNKAGGRRSWLQDAINANPNLDKDNTIYFPNYGITWQGGKFVIAGDSSQTASDSITTKFGVINDVNTASGTLAATTGLPVIRSSMTYGNKTYAFEKIAQTFPTKEVHVVVNILPSDSTQAYPDSAAIDNIITDFAGIIDQHFAPYNIYYVAIQNEFLNKTYYRLDGSSVRRYAYLLQRLGGLFKSRDARYYISDGGITGPALDWLVLHYLDSTGQTEEYNHYKAARFTPAQQAGADNWDVTGPYTDQIARYREYFSYLKDIDSIDAVSLHYPLPINDSADFDTTSICAAVEAYSFLSGGKEVVFNEVGFRNQSTTIPTNVISKFIRLKSPYVIFYNGADTTYTGRNNAFAALDGTALRPNGTVLQNRFSGIKKIIRNILEILKDGTIRFPGIPNAGALGTDNTGKVILGSGGTGGGTGSVTSVGITSTTLNVTNTPVVNSGNINVEIPSNYVTTNGTQTLTNKSGNISQWTNDAGYVTDLSPYATISSLNNYLLKSEAAATYEPKITAGATAQYWRGDKTWQNLSSINISTFPNDVSYITRSGISAATGKPISYNSTTGVIDFDTTTNHSYNFYNTKYLGIPTLAQGGVIYASSASVIASTAAGTAGQFLQSNGTGAPTWVGLPLKTPITLTDAATVSWNYSLGYNASVTLAGNRTLSISNATAGDYGTIKVIQDATGSRTLTLPSNSRVNSYWGVGTAINLSTAPASVDILNWYYDGTNFYWTLGRNYQ
jgi:hypothetical protein